MFVIKRTDQGGGYVAPAGSKHSYVRNLQHARAWPTREAAEAERCPGNEVIVAVDEELDSRSL